MAAAKAQYEQLKRVDPKDRRIDYAYALVLVNQHKYHDAIPLLSRYLESGKGELNAYSIKMWAQIQDRRYADVLDQASALSQRFPKDAGAAPRADYLDAARFLGTVFGYLELARPAAIDSQLKTARKNEILTRLGERYSKSFDEGRNAVAERLAELQGQREAEQEKSVAAIEKKKDQIKDELQKDRQKISDREEKAQTSSEQLRDATRELSVVQQQLGSLNGDRTRLGIQIITLQAQLTQILGPLNFVVTPNSNGGLTANGVTPANPTIATYAQARAASLALAALNKQAFDMDRKILALKSRAAELSGTGEQQAATIEKSEQDVEQAEKHAKAIERRLHRETPRPTSRAGVLTGKMTLLSTYAPFPYEQEKKRVLTWFAK